MNATTFANTFHMQQSGTMVEAPDGASRPEQHLISCLMDAGFKEKGGAWTKDGITAILCGRDGGRLSFSE